MPVVGSVWVNEDGSLGCVWTDGVIRRSGGVLIAPYTVYADAIIGSMWVYGEYLYWIDYDRRVRTSNTHYTENDFFYSAIVGSFFLQDAGPCYISESYRKRSLGYYREG